MVEGLCFSLVGSLCDFWGVSGTCFYTVLLCCNVAFTLLRIDFNFDLSKVIHTNVSVKKEAISSTSYTDSFVSTSKLCLAGKLKRGFCLSAIL